MAKRKLSPVMSGLLNIMRDFAPWTSTDAIPHAFTAQSFKIAIFWMVVFFGALGLSIWQVYLAIARYLSFSVTVDSRIVSGIQAFPCITFCNSNPWKRSQVGGTLLEGLVQAYDSGQANAQYGFDSPFSMRESMRAQKWSRMMFEQLKFADQNQSANIGYTLNDLVIDCTISRLPCDLTMTSDYYDPFYGRCHTFNPEGRINISRAGPNFGLRLQLRSPLNDYLPWVQAAGIVFYVHKVNETQFIDVSANLAEVGRATSVGVKYFLRTKLGSPYNECIKEGSSVMNYYDGLYNVEGCFRSCLQNKIIKDCGCYDPQYKVAPDSNAISCYDADDVNAALDCTEDVRDQVTANVNLTTIFNLANDCQECIFSCDLSYYKVSMSQGTWPAKKYTPIECYNSSLSIWTDVDQCREWYRKNTVSLLFYYERIDWQTDIESADYDIISMLADTGGSIGLWLGMSIVSILEFIILFVVMIVYMIIKPKRPDLGGFDYWAQFDKLIEENINDDDPDLIYGDSDKEDDVNMPPKVQEPNKSMHVTDLDDQKDKKGPEEPKAEPTKEDVAPATVVEPQPLNLPLEPTTENAKK